MRETLARLSALLADAGGPWWIIGSAAVALHGGNPVEVRDVDVLLAHEDAERYLRQLGLRNAATTNDPLFRSDLLMHWLEPPLAVEMMAGLQVNGSGGWVPISIQTRVAVAEGLYVPERAELRSILLTFGRAKDVRRAATLG